MEMPKLRKPWSFKERRRLVYSDGFTQLLTGYVAGEDQAIVSLDDIEGHEYVHLSFRGLIDSPARDKAIRDVFGSAPIRRYVTEITGLGPAGTLHVVPADYPREYAEDAGTGDLPRA